MFTIHILQFSIFRAAAFYAKRKEQACKDAQINVWENICKTIQFYDKYGTVWKNVKFALTQKNFVKSALF